MNANQEQYNLEELFMIVPLGTTAHSHARQFAKVQANAEKAAQVYLQILTVYAAHCYLKYLDIESDLDLSEGWNLAIATLQKVQSTALGNFASLHLPKFGDLECILVHPGDRLINLPDYAKEHKIGLLVLRSPNIEVTEITEMEVIGFVSDLSQLPIAIDRLPSTDELFDRLESIQLFTLQLFAPVQIYLPELSIEQIKVELEKIYQKSDDLRFEYDIFKFLKSGLVQDSTRELELAREKKDDLNPDRELQALAADLAEQLQDLWGRLE